jgi:peptidoglycan-N-acetylglucosamine deacetylase
MKSKFQSLVFNCKLNTRTNDIFTGLLVLVFMVLLSNITNAQQQPAKFAWPKGKQMALSLSFDDARLSQPDKGIPVLDKYGVKATFYLIPSAMEQRLDGWKKAVASGHDIGNHSLSHPCTGNFDWSRDNALENYTLQGMALQLDSANKILKKELGIQAVSFAFPCGQTFVGNGKNTKSYVPVVSSMFETARLWLSEGPNDPSFCDMAQLTGVELDGKSFDEAKKIIESAKSKGQWLIFAGHEMNDSGTQTSRLATIEAICKYASDSANGIWITTVHNIASYVKDKRGEKPFADTLAYKNPLLPINERIEDLLSRMTLKEKVGQMNIPTCYSMELGYGLGSHAKYLWDDPSRTNRDKQLEGCRKWAEGTHNNVIGPGGGFFTLSDRLIYEGTKR